MRMVLFEPACLTARASAAAFWGSVGRRTTLARRQLGARSLSTKGLLN